MKGSLIVVAFFCAGCMIGAANNFQYDMHSVSMYVLYALMLQVGISIGSNKKLKELIKSLRPKMLLVPMATIAVSYTHLDVYKRQVHQSQDRCTRGCSFVRVACRLEMQMCIRDRCSLYTTDLCYKAASRATTAFQYSGCHK